MRARARARRGRPPGPAHRAKVPSSATGGEVDERNGDRQPVEQASCARCRTAVQPRAARTAAPRPPGRSMTAKPFLFLSARPEVEAVGPEYESVRRATGLDASRLDHLRLDVDPLRRSRPRRRRGHDRGRKSLQRHDSRAGKHPVQLRVEADLARLAEPRSPPTPRALHLLRHRGAHPRARRKGRHTARRTDGGRRGRPHRRRGRRPPRRRAAPAVRRARRAQGGHRAPPRRCRAARVIRRLPRADLPGRAPRLRDAVPSRGLDAPTSSPARRCTGTTATSPRANCAR